MAILQIVFFAGSVSAQERDPFSPSGNGVMSKVKELMTNNAEGAATPEQKFDNSNPLTSLQLASYKVSGVIISDTQKIASIKAMNGVSYLVKIGDSLGSENGKISDISIEGITVQTKSQEIKLPVSNIVEVPIGNATEKKN